jgi:Flp pilus assembly protein TadD
MSEPTSSDPAVRAYQLMCSGNLLAALPLAEQAVAGRQVCLPVHGMLATLLLQLGRAADAEAVVAQALELRQGSADSYDALAHVSMLLGNHERSNALMTRASGTTSRRASAASAAWSKPKPPATRPSD